MQLRPRKRCKAAPLPAAVPATEDRKTAEGWTAAAVSALVARQLPGLASLPHVLLQTVSRFVDSLTNWTLESASKAGQSVYLLDRLLAREWSGVSDSFRKARFLVAIESVATAGHVHVLEWWRSKYLPRGPDTTDVIFRLAAHEGHVHVLQWLFDSADAKRRTILPIGTRNAPVFCLHPEIVRWLHARNRRDRLVLVMDEAAKKGDLEFMKWALEHENTYPFQYTDDSMTDAAKAGHLDVLKWLRANDLDESVEHALEAAAMGGHVHVMKWLLSEYTDQDFGVRVQRQRTIAMSTLSSGWWRNIPGGARTTGACGSSMRSLLLLMKAIGTLSSIYSRRRLWCWSRFVVWMPLLTRAISSWFSGFMHVGLDTILIQLELLL